VQNPTTHSAAPAAPSAPAIHASSGMAVMIEAEASTIPICTAAEASS